MEPKPAPREQIKASATNPGSRGCTSSRNATDEITAYSVVEEEDRNATPRRCGKGEGEERPSVSPRAGEQHSPISEKEAGGSPADTRAGADAICNRWEGRAIASAEVPAPLCSATRLPSPVAKGDESGHHRGRTRAPGAHPELAETRHSEAVVDPDSEPQAPGRGGRRRQSNAGR